MTSNNIPEIVQTSQDQPLGKTIFTELDSAKQYLDQIQSKGLQWNQIGLFSDAKYHNLLTLLFNDDELIDVFRFSLEGEGNEKLVSYVSESYQLQATFKVSEKEDFTLEDIQEIGDIELLWNDISIESKNLNSKETTKLFNRWQTGREKSKGRGDGFSQETKRIVMQESHGRCMFSGCGKRLDLDSLTGHRGNFGYLAHNIAASENGPRGVLYLSANLADEPKNVLLLCDIHHRLVDRVASIDYPASRLEKMREDHIELCNKLLDALNYSPVPIFFIPWGVNGQAIEKPCSISIAKSLSVVNHRALDNIISLPYGENESIECVDDFHAKSPTFIKQCVEKIQLLAEEKRIAVFAFGPSSSLIGFGAKFGNKSKLIPMLRYRDANSWTWPRSEPRSDAIIIEEALIEPEHKQVIVSVKLTAPAPKIDKTIAWLQGKQQSSIPVINIYPKDYAYGNGSVAHPVEGEKLAVKLKNILTDLNETYSVETVHLLVCASNAACVYIGQAIDRFQPELLVYDFNQEMMEPKLRIHNDGNNTLVECINADCR